MTPVYDLFTQWLASNRGVCRRLYQREGKPALVVREVQVVGDTTGSIVKQESGAFGLVYGSNIIR